MAKENALNGRRGPLDRAAIREELQHAEGLDFADGDVVYGGPRRGSPACPIVPLARDEDLTLGAVRATDPL